MLRHGLLSPHSKLLPQVDSRAATPLDGRPGSIMSVASNGEFFIMVFGFESLLKYLFSICDD